MDKNHVSASTGSFSMLDSVECVTVWERAPQILTTANRPTGTPGLFKHARHYLRNQAGWSTWDLLATLAAAMVLLVFVTLLMPRRYNGHTMQRISCVNNLKQIGTAYRVWAGDNNDRMPWTVTGTNGGAYEVFSKGNAGSVCWTNYALMANELGQSPRVVLCPCDERTYATNFEHFDNRNVSYFVGFNASDTFPQTLLGGDRNLGPGLTPKKDYGYSPANNAGADITLSTNCAKSPITWSLKMHSAGNTPGTGNLLLGDGSVQQCTSSRLRIEYQANAGAPLAADEVVTNSSAKYPSFRLIFP